MARPRNNKYVHFLQRALANPRRIIAGFGMAIVFIIVLNRVIPSSFLPEEDQGYFKVELALPEGATLERTRKVTERAVDYLKEHPAVAYVQSAWREVVPVSDKPIPLGIDRYPQTVGRTQERRNVPERSDE